MLSGFSSLCTEHISFSAVFLEVFRRGEEKRAMICSMAITVDRETFVYLLFIFWYEAEKEIFFLLLVETEKEIMCMGNGSIL